MPGWPAAYDCPDASSDGGCSARTASARASAAARLPRVALVRETCLDPESGSLLSVPGLVSRLFVFRGGLSASRS